MTKKKLEFNSHKSSATSHLKKNTKKKNNSSNVNEESNCPINPEVVSHFMRFYPKLLKALPDIIQEKSRKDVIQKIVDHIQKRLQEMKDLEEEVEQVNKAMEYLKEQDAEASKIAPYSDRIAEFTKNIVIKEEVVESYQPVVDVSITPEANVVESAANIQRMPTIIPIKQELIFDISSTVSESSPSTENIIGENSKRNSWLKNFKIPKVSKKSEDSGSNTESTKTGSRRKAAVPIDKFEIDDSAYASHDISSQTPVPRRFAENRNSSEKSGIAATDKNLQFNTSERDIVMDKLTVSENQEDEIIHNEAPLTVCESTSSQMKIAEPVSLVKELPTSSAKRILPAEKELPSKRVSKHKKKTYWASADHRNEAGVRKTMNSERGHQVMVATTPYEAKGQSDHCTNRREGIGSWRGDNGDDWHHDRIQNNRLCNKPYPQPSSWRDQDPFLNDFPSTAAHGPTHYPSRTFFPMPNGTSSNNYYYNQYENSHWNNTNSFQGPRHAGQGFPGGRHYGESLSNFQPNQLILRPTQAFHMNNTMTPHRNANSPVCQYTPTRSSYSPTSCRYDPAPFYGGATPRYGKSNPRFDEADSHYATRGYYTSQINVPTRDFATPARTFIPHSDGSRYSPTSPGR